MAAPRSVLIDGRPVTWEKLDELALEPSRFCPVEFDVAKRLPVDQANRLYAWLKRRGVPNVELGKCVCATSRRPLPKRLYRNPV